MNTSIIIKQLKAEKVSLERAIAALCGTRRKSTLGRHRRHRLSAEARKRISEGMKKRWAARRKSA